MLAPIKSPPSRPTPPRSRPVALSAQFAQMAIPRRRCGRPLGPRPRFRQGSLPNPGRPRRSRLQVLLPQPQISVQTRLGLMFIAANDPSALTRKTSARLGHRMARCPRRPRGKIHHPRRGKSSRPVDEKAAAKRREKRESRVAEGVALLGQSLLDLVREGLASPAARDPPLGKTSPAA
jgi:hypothetical protein